MGEDHNTPSLPDLEALDAWWEAFGVGGDTCGLRYGDLAPMFAPAPVLAKGNSISAPTASRTIAAPQAKGFEDLVAEITAFDGCELKAACQNTVVYDGVSSARVLILGDAPSAQDDAAGKPFMGPAGALLDNMLAAIGLSRAENCLISNMVYWSPPRNRTPKPEELALCLPFVERMIEIVDPALILSFGEAPAQTLLQNKTSITRLRGTQQNYVLNNKSYPLMAGFHPNYLLKRPHDKARAWRDLLAMQAVYAAL